MTDAGVDAQLDLVRLHDALSIRAFVAAAPPRNLVWKLVTSSRTAGGTSNVSQSGATDGRSRDPVSVVRVGPNSQGCVVLTVFDGAREVARQAFDLAQWATAAPDCR